MSNPLGASFCRTTLVAAFLCIFGSVAPARAERRLFSGGRIPEMMSGNFSGVVLTLFIDKQIVQSWLPPGLRLAKECPYVDHPVLILFGTQKALTRHKRISLQLPYGRYYLETFVAVPYLRIASRADGEPVFHFVRVYVDSVRARNQGVRRFGWNKLCVPIAKANRNYDIFDRCRVPRFESTTDYSRLAPVRAENVSLGKIREMLSQTLVLRHRGNFDRYHFDLHFDKAKFRSVPTKIRISSGFMPGLPPMEAEISGINEQEFGAFFIDCWFTKVSKDAGGFWDRRIEQLLSQQGKRCRAPHLRIMRRPGKTKRLPKKRKGSSRQPHTTHSS